MKTGSEIQAIRKVLKKLDSCFHGKDTLSPSWRNILSREKGYLGRTKLSSPEG